ncbi:Glyco hydro 1 domain containing protein [Asbolus verrucosus]|uniref:beta-glucosidase n=1 Tax=Asbolus verrucosus TaxID=1661398 RepID=A0A482VNG5_ASBVE|nr:Glyco hydro 1 domain containing protein [Asbolus verrucosus]
MGVKNRTFPPNFKFGVATASYQIKGAWNEDGKGENIWNHICHTNPKFVDNEDNGDIACDSYHKYKEDVAMLKELGVDFYRFSLSWSRIMPKGLAGSPVNQAGIDYYRNLLQELLRNNIEPLVTTSPNHCKILVAGQTLNLRNTMPIMLEFCYGAGTIAPGIKASGYADYKCTHKLIKAHAKAYHLYNDEFRTKQQSLIGLVVDSEWYEPASDSVEDQEASERALQFTFGWFVNPIVNGNYPKIMIDRVAKRSQKQGYAESRLPKFTSQEIDYIKGTHHFVALNCYTTYYAQSQNESNINEVSFETDMNVNRFFDKDWEESASSWLKVEGGWNEDGKGENIWDHLCHTNPDFVFNSDNGDIACNSYHKYKEDVTMLKEVGVDYYRFSLSWSRILPKALAGTPINQAGVDYYRNLTKELLDNNIEPMVTIFHWDLPEPLQDIGGWPNPELEDHYAYYARVVFEELGDLVKIWLTFNEPKQTCLEGYGTGNLAPGITASGVADYKCAHTLLKAHAKAYHIYDKEFREAQQGTVSLVADTTWFEPATDSDQDKEAAERALQFSYGWYINPVVNGNYPQVMIDRIDEKSKQQGYPESRLPKFTTEEMDYIKGTYDFIALNSFTTLYTAWLDDGNISDVNYYSDLNVAPWGLRKLVNWVSSTYKNPEIFITENGFSDKGGLEDDGRVNYYREYLSNLLEAILYDGVNVTRFTAWSLMDNFEWDRGYRQEP